MGKRNTDGGRTQDYMPAGAPDCRLKTQRAVNSRPQARTGVRVDKAVGMAVLRSSRTGRDPVVEHAVAMGMRTSTSWACVQALELHMARRGVRGRMHHAS